MYYLRLCHSRLEGPKVREMICFFRDDYRHQTRSRKVGASQAPQSPSLATFVHWPAVCLRTEEWIVYSVAYADDTVVVASQDSLIHFFDAKTGRKRLLYDTGIDRFGPGPVIHGDLAYFTSADGRIWAIDRRANTYPAERIIWRVKINIFVWQVIPWRPVQRGTVWTRG